MRIFQHFKYLTIFIYIQSEFPVELFSNGKYYYLCNIFRKKHTDMQIIKKNWTYIIGIILGAIAGYLYWKYVGCSSGTCATTSSPTISSLYGALMGGLFGGMFKRKEINKQN